MGRSNFGNFEVAMALAGGRSEYVVDLSWTIWRVVAEATSVFNGGFSAHGSDLFAMQLLLSALVVRATMFPRPTKDTLNSESSHGFRETRLSGLLCEARCEAAC